MKQSADFLIKVAWEGGHVGQRLGSNAAWDQIDEVIGNRGGQVSQRANLNGIGKTPLANILRSTGLWSMLHGGDIDSKIPYKHQQFHNPNYYSVSEVPRGVNPQSAIMDKYPPIKELIKDVSKQLPVTPRDEVAKTLPKAGGFLAKLLRRVITRR